MPQLELSGDRLCDGGERAGQSLGCALGCILAGEQGKQGWAEGQGDLKAVPTEVQQKKKKPCPGVGSVSTELTLMKLENCQ